MYMDLIEITCAILLGLGYVVGCKWLVVRIAHKVGIRDCFCEWIGFIVAVILIPLALRYYFLFEIQGLALAILIIYSLYFVAKQIKEVLEWKRSLV